MPTDHVLSPPESENPLQVAGERRLYRALRRYWHPVMYASELDERPKRVVLQEEALVVVRLGGGVRCFADLCVHRGTALSKGWVEGDQLRCAYHGWTYGPDGVCTAIPARFGHSVPRRARLTAYHCAEKDGLIWVCLADEPALPLPEFPHFNDPSFRSVQVPTYDWRCSAHRRIENYVDLAHFAWVHDGILGDRERPEIPDHDVWREGGELRFGEGFAHEPHWSVDDAGQQRARDRDGLPFETGTVLADKTYRLFMPLTVLLDQRLPGDRHYLLFFTASPVGPTTTRCFTFMTRNYDLDPAEDEKFLQFNETVIEQDRPVVESQRPEELPFDLSAELHIKGIDRVAIEYRKWLVELANAEPA